MFIPKLPIHLDRYNGIVLREYSSILDKKMNKMKWQEIIAILEFITSMSALQKLIFIN